MDERWVLDFFGPQVGRAVLESQPGAIDRAALQLNAVAVTSVMMVSSFAALPYHLALGCAMFITLGLRSS